MLAGQFMHTHACLLYPCLDTTVHNKCYCGYNDNCFMLINFADEQVQYTISTTTTAAVTSSLVSSTATTSTASVGVQPITPAGKRVYTCTK